ncbi:hypothetical protein AWB69_01799 [Caballeronia udeis]|uniref:Uncharacterized protein n=1 Tax=Caballeronia udeis TaxID=1232866 RepID=A0A158FY76_9BURK|nr:hypothetical protein AWB69_01799 [Caballeronia udeis]
MNRVAARCSVHRVSLFEASFFGLRMSSYIRLYPLMPPIPRSPAMAVQTHKITAPLLRGMH